jgi:N-acetylneuraminic acid mutarotase
MKTLTTILCVLMKKKIRLYLNSSVIISLKLIIFSATMQSLVSTSYAQSPWTQKTDMSTERWAHSSIAMDGKIYVVGGQDSIKTKNGLIAFNTMGVYDPILDSWEVKANLNTGRANFATCALNGKILAVGGSRTFYYSPLKSIEEYDPVSDVWTHKTDMPRPRIGPTASLVNDKIYIIGGGDGNYETIAENDAYYTLTKTWSTIADIPTPRINPQAVVLNGKIYVIGGVTGASDGEKSLTTVEEYDPVTDTWTQKAGMKFKRKYFGACAINGKIYVFGGAMGSCAGELSSVEVYDPITDTWIEGTDMPTSIGCLSVAQVNGKAYITGGGYMPVQGTCNGVVVSTVYEYNPHYDLFLLVEKIELDRGYTKPGTGSVCLATKISNPAGITIMAYIKAPDQTPVDSLELFDDGNHNDGNAGDSLYANLWPVNSAEEQNYYVDLQVTRIDMDTVINSLNNMASFTTIGPVTVENYTFAGDDTIPEPGDKIYLEITLRNNGSTATATKVAARLISLDPLVTIPGTSRSFGNIAAGENSISSSIFTLTIDEEWPGNTPISILAEITGNDYPYWKETLSITGEPVNIKDIKEPITRIYPNPTDNMLNIEVNNAGQQVLEIEIYTITGKLIYQKEYKSIHAQFVEQINLTDYAKGIYLMKVKQTNTIYFGKVVVR